MSSSNLMFSAVFFDLDGTLADTAPDLAAALNRLLLEHGRTPLTLAQIRPQATNGVSGLLGLGFGLQASDSEFAPLAQRYLALYAAHLSEHTRLFPGIETLLDRLDEHEIPWGIVTNKPRRFTLPLLAALQLDQRCAAIVSGDDCAAPKPAADSLLRACELIGRKPQADIFYVGDDERDIIASHAAGLTSVAIAWNQTTSVSEIESWQVQASHIISQPDQLLKRHA